MIGEQTKQWFQILDLKNEIENLKLTISNIKISIGYSKNKNHTSKLKEKEVVLNRRLKDLCDQKHKLEKQYNMTWKAERKEEF